MAVYDHDQALRGPGLSGGAVCLW